MKPQITQLDNGIRVVTAEMPSVYSVSVSIMIGVGSRYEDFEKNGGVSHYLEHMLFKGSKKWPDWRTLSSTLDSLGGMNNAYTANDMTSFYIKLPSQHTALALEILSDMVQNPLFKPDEVERERGVMLEEMKVRRTEDPAQYAGELLPRLLWPNDPLGYEVMGREEVVNNIPREEIVNFQHTHYVPDNVVVSLAGKVKHDWAVKQVEKFMGQMPRRHKPGLAKLDPRLSKQLTRHAIQDTKQAHITIGSQAYSYDHPRHTAGRVLASILGSGMSSRLFMEIRERLGLAYTVYAESHSFIDTGIFDVYAGVNLDKVELAIEAVFRELDKMRTQKVSAEELTRVKNKMSGGLQLSMENTLSVADRFGGRLLLLDRVKTIEETLAEIERVTAADVQEAANDMLDPAKLRMAIVSPAPADAEHKFEQLAKGK